MSYQDSVSTAEGFSLWMWWDRNAVQAQTTPGYDYCYHMLKNVFFSKEELKHLVLFLESA